MLTSLEYESEKKHTESSSVSNNTKVSEDVFGSELLLPSFR